MELEKQDKVEKQDRIGISADKITIFGEADLNDKGLPKSEYPSWYFDVFEDELREEIRRKEYQLSEGLIPETEIGITRERLKQEKSKLDSLEKSKPQLSEQQLDNVNKIRKEIGVQIKDAQFTYTDMMRGTADAHDEAKRMSEPVLQAKGKTLEFIHQCNIPTTSDGKLSRTAMEKAWKIASKILGENTDTETLRRN